jgi:hypothetical protein
VSRGQRGGSPTVVNLSFLDQNQQCKLYKTYVRFEVFMAVTMKNAAFWDVMLCGSCKNRVSEEPSASINRVTRIGELGTTLEVTSNRRRL